MQSLARDELLFAQLLTNGFILGCAYALVALGFGLIYITTRTFHFAHGAVYTCGGYIFYVFYGMLKFPLFASIALSLLIVPTIGIAIERIIYRPLVEKSSSLMIQMLSSLGVYIIIVNLIAMIFGSETKVLDLGIQSAYSIGRVVVTRIQLITVFVSLALFGIFAGILRFTSLGRILRALRDNPALVSVMGINPSHIRLTVFALGSFLAAVASVLLTLDVGIDPNTGMGAILNGAVAVIVGGLGVFEGAFVGALLIGLLQGFSIWKMSAKWQEMITFMTLILFLLFRPQGLFGSKKRVEEERE